IHCLSKSSGVPVLPDPRSGRQSCLSFLVERERLERQTKDRRAWERPRIVHRIDRATSGVVLVARDLHAEQWLSRAFETSRVRKEYAAILRGVVAPARVVIDCAIVPGRKGRMRGALRGPSASTELTVIERYADSTLVVARPRTGRTHQIRVHTALLGHPVLGDPLYGGAHEQDPELPPDGRASPPIARLALHAWRYVVPDPDGREEVFTVPLAP